MKKLRRVWCILLVLVLAFALAACNGDDPAPAGDAGGGTATDGAAAPSDNAGGSGETQAYEIAFVVPGLENPYFVDVESGAMQAIADLAAEGKMVNCTVQAPTSETSIEDWVALVENAVTRQVQAIVVSLPDATACIPAIVKCNEAGIPVFIVDAPVDEEALAEAGGEYVTFIGTDSVYAGSIVAQTFGEMFAEAGAAGEVIELGIVEGAPGQKNAIDRMDGFMQKIVEYDYINIVASQTANWEMQQAYDVVTNMITANPNIQAIYSMSDQMGLGVTKAVEDAGRADDITVITIDAMAEGRDNIRAGRLYGSVSQYPFNMGYQGILAAVQIVDDPGYQFEKYINTGSVLVTIDNVDID